MRIARIRYWSWLAAGLVGAGAVLPSLIAVGEESVGHAPLTTAESAPRSLALFEALSQNVVEARFIPQSAAQAVVYFKNVAATPLELQLPAAFGAVHVLAQVGAGGFGAGGLGAGGIGGPGIAQGGLAQGGLAQGGLAQGGLAQGGLAQGGGGQGLGGGFGGGGGLNGAALNGGGLGGGGFNVGGGGGLFRIEPGKTRKLLVHTVCLEHGKPDPRPRMTYQLVPLENVNNDPTLTQLCQLLGQGSVTQPIAQAAAWHLANGLTWEELRQKNRHESRYTGNVRWFSGAEIESAWEVTQRCQTAVHPSGTVADSWDESSVANLSGRPTSTASQAFQTNTSAGN